uniref:site-specific DNA-methyltransferase (adenine-specific) n=1 Tax=viral metagenome TaxID=1070528 RepID=A0A6C0EIF1_9ZZZZ
MNYSEVSKELTGILSKAVKKNNGIYFTPPSTIYKNLALLQPYFTDIKTVLEPSCGSGEYILALDKLYPNIDITGIEFNEVIYNSIKNLASKNIVIKHQDYLTYSADIGYDLIIGNPPYYVMKKEQVDTIYHPYFDGRPNIFILFIIKSIGLLNTNGILSFVLPKNFTNCLYYNKTREYISKKYQILTIEHCNDTYLETGQETIILIIKNQSNIDNSAFVKQINKYTIFGSKSNLEHLESLYKNYKTLDQMGFLVNIGTVVWNQCKDILTDNSDETRLIYSSDIKNNQVGLFEFPKFKKKQGTNELIPNPKKNYIKKKGIKGPLLIINRGYGVGEYQFNYSLLDIPTRFLIENHLMVIKFKNKLPKSILLNLYNKIIKSFKDPRSQAFTELYFGNNAINTTELNHIMPIYQDI